MKESCHLCSYLKCYNLLLHEKEYRQTRFKRSHGNNSVMFVHNRLYLFFFFYVSGIEYITTKNDNTTRWMYWLSFRLSIITIIHIHIQMLAPFVHFGFTHQMMNFALKSGSANVLLQCSIPNCSNWIVTIWSGIFMLEYVVIKNSKS